MTSNQYYMSDFEFRLRQRENALRLGRFDIENPLTSQDSREALLKVWRALEAPPLRVGQLIQSQGGSVRHFEMTSEAVTAFYEKHPEGVIAKGLLAERPFITCLIEGHISNSASYARKGAAAWGDTRGLLSIVDTEHGVVFAGEWGGNIASLAKYNFIDRHTGNLSVPKLLCFLAGEQVHYIESNGTMNGIALRDSNN